MKIVIEIESTDILDETIKEFRKECRSATSMNIEVGRPLPRCREVFRIVSISSEYFKVRVEN